MSRMTKWANISFIVLSACQAAPQPAGTPGSSDRQGRTNEQAASAPIATPVATSPAKTLRIERLDPRFDALVPSDARLEVVVEGFHWLEGPAWTPDGRLVFSDIPANRIHAWRPEVGVEVFLEQSGYSGEAPFKGREPGSNGLTIDAQGRLVICQHGDRQVVRVERDGTKTVLARTYEGRRLNSPNDVVVHSSGALYFTDPPFGLPGTFNDPQRELAVSGVYRVVEGQPVQLVIDGLKAPNGLALSPDEKTLYVSDVDPDRPAWWSYPVKADGTVGPGKKLRDALPYMTNRKGGPDGIEVDATGNLFAAGPEGVYVFSSTGEHLGTLFTGVPTANLEWGDDGSTLYVAANTRILRVALTTTGASRPRPRDLIVSANDGKFVRDNGRGTYPRGAGTDSLTVLDASVQPPRVLATVDVQHSIHGPPQSVAVTPDGKLAFVSAPDRYDYRRMKRTTLRFVQVVDLEAQPPRVTARINVGGHPQALSISPDGRLLLATTAAGHVAVIQVRDGSATLKAKVKLDKGKLSGVSFTADGNAAIVALRDAQGIAILDVDGDTVEDSGERVASGVTPYAIDVSADGRWAVVSNVGLAAIDGRKGRLHGDDHDTLTVIDTSERPFRAVQHLTTPAIPEGVAMSPDGRRIVAVTMAGSNLPAGSPGHRPRGRLALFERRDGRFVQTSTVESGTASQGAVFTRDGRRVIVQYNVERALAVYAVNDGQLVDTEVRIALQAGPTSLRATPRR